MPRYFFQQISPFVYLSTNEKAGTVTFCFKYQGTRKDYTDAIILWSKDTLVPCDKLVKMNKRLYEGHQILESGEAVECDPFSMDRGEFVFSVKPGFKPADAVKNIIQALGAQGHIEFTGFIDRIKLEETFGITLDKQPHPRLRRDNVTSINRTRD